MSAEPPDRGNAGKGPGRAQPPAATPALRRAKIMMVDDDTLMTDIVKEYLQESGCAPLVATNDPVSAEARIRQEKPDLLLLDLMMPERSGFDILEAVRADPELKSLPVIVLTAAADAPHRMKALELGAHAVLAKPIEAARLFEQLERQLSSAQDRASPPPAGA